MASQDAALDDRRAVLARNLQQVRQRIAAAAAREGRSPADVRLVAVTKYADLVTTRLLVELGCYDLGESRPQELWRKAAALDNPAIRWHMIGHLQRNKIARTLDAVYLLHSADRWSLIEALEHECRSRGRKLAALLEVNTSGDASKGGFAPEVVEPMLDQIAQLQWVELRGLMTMAAREGDDAVARSNFASLRALRDRLVQRGPPSLSWHELSMGMSGDYELAVEQGATIVRVGSALFEGLE
ncbi:MAG TPA: YggS family pyridoxal phosphate-dependent enzyme [Pirellulales bacterium]|nr:YggS family pyridoxal phosphate-dependent enzyme [Pirellulales bacterium]